MEPAQPRVATFAMMREAIPDGFAGNIHDCRVRDLFPAVGVCGVGQPGDTVVATGSIYLIGELLLVLLLLNLLLQLLLHSSLLKL